MNSFGNTFVGKIPKDYLDPLYVFNCIKISNSVTVTVYKSWWIKGFPKQNYGTFLQKLRVDGWMMSVLVVASLLIRRFFNMGQILRSGQYHYLFSQCKIEKREIVRFTVLLFSWKRFDFDISYPLKPSCFWESVELVGKLNFPVFLISLWRKAIFNIGHSPKM